ncbi:hypothetical protein GW17_00029925, partial [Ensete ventricosum]
RGGCRRKLLPTPSFWPPLGFKVEVREEMENSLRYDGDSKSLRIHAKEKIPLASKTLLQVCTPRFLLLSCASQKRRRNSWMHINETFACNFDIPVCNSVFLPLYAPSKLDRNVDCRYLAVPPGNGCFRPLPREIDRQRSISSGLNRGRKKKRKKKKRSGLSRGREKEEEGEEENLDFFPHHAIRR